MRDMMMDMDASETYRNDKKAMVEQVINTKTRENDLAFAVGDSCQWWTNLSTGISPVVR
jgi:hypothetical protein